MVPLNGAQWQMWLEHSTAKTSLLLQFFHIQFDSLGFFLLTYIKMNILKSSLGMFN